MTRWLSVAVVVALALVGGSSLVAQVDDAHIGTWKQNFEKSKSTPAPTGPRPQSVTRIYEPFEGKGIKATFITITADGKKLTSSYSAHFDGKDYPYTGGGNLASIALKKVDRYTWEATNKVLGTAVMSARTRCRKTARRSPGVSRGRTHRGSRSPACRCSRSSSGAPRSVQLARIH